MWGGLPPVRGTRIPVWVLLEYFGDRGSVDGVLELFPYLTRDQVQDAIDYYAACPKRVDDDRERNARALAELQGRHGRARCPAVHRRDDSTRPRSWAPSWWYDAESCEKAGRANRQISDEEQLAYAASVGRAILTVNASDFCPLDAAWKARGRIHHGIIVAPQVSDLGLLVRCVRRHLDPYAPRVQYNVLLWLDTSPPP